MSYKTESKTITSIGLINRHFYKIKATQVEINNQFKSRPTSEFEFDGFIQPVSGRELNNLGKYGEKITSRLYFLDDRVKFNYTIESSGQKYVVVHITQPQGISGKMRHREALLSKVN